jgi:stage V sporulation protein S
VADAGLDLVCTPAFAEIAIDGETRTALKLLVEDRTGSSKAPVETA